MTFGNTSQTKKAINSANSATNNANTIATPKGFNIGGAGGGGFGIDLGGTPQGRGNLPYADHNLGLANSGINNLLKGFAGQNPFTNQYTKALMELARSDQRGQRRDMKNNLNARGQNGGSFEAMMMKGLQETFNNQNLQAKLTGFDKTLAALQGLGQSSANTQQQYLEPLRMAQQGMLANNQNNLGRGQLSMQLAPNVMQANLGRKNWGQGYMDYIQDNMKILASVAGKAGGGP